MPDSCNITSYLVSYWPDFSGFCIIPWNLNLVKLGSGDFRIDILNEQWTPHGRHSQCLTLARLDSLVCTLPFQWPQAVLICTQAISISRDRRLSWLLRDVKRGCSLHATELKGLFKDWLWPGSCPYSHRHWLALCWPHGWVMCWPHVWAHASNLTAQSSQLTCSG